MSTIFDSIGIDPGIIIIALLAIVVILIGVMISNGMRLTRLERKYKMFMKGSDAQSLEKTFVRKFAQIEKKIMNMQLKHWNSILKLFSANMA